MHYLSLSYHQIIKSLTIFSVILFFFTIPFIPSILNSNESYGLISDRPAPDFILTDARSNQVSLTDFRGKFVYLMFGYLNCKDICHTQVLNFKEISLHADIPDEVHFLYISMDPNRDTARQLAAYFDSRGDNFTSLIETDLTKLQNLAGKYHAFFSRNGASETNYDIEHNGLYFLIGPNGYINKIYSATQTNLNFIVSDLLQLKREIYTL